MTNFYIKYHIHPISFKAQGIACSLFCLNVLSVTKKPKAMKTKTQYTKNEIKYCPLHDFDYTSKIINQHFFLHFFFGTPWYYFFTDFKSGCTAGIIYSVAASCQDEKICSCYVHQPGLTQPRMGHAWGLSHDLFLFRVCIVHYQDWFFCATVQRFTARHRKNDTFMATYSLKVLRSK